jgi:hypothetical protein
MVLKFSQGNDIPLQVSLAHGGVAVAGLAVLFVVVSDGGDMASKVALGAYILAALGGCTIFLMGRLFKKPVPGLMITGHALIALTGCTAIRWATYAAFTGA